jgi:hypothetical protein
MNEVIKFFVWLTVTAIAIAIGFVLFIVIRKKIIDKKAAKTTTK